MTSRIKYVIQRLTEHKGRRDNPVWMDCHRGPEAGYPAHHEGIVISDLERLRHNFPDETYRVVVLTDFTPARKASLTVR